MCTLRSILVLVVVVAHDHCFAQKSLVALFRRVREMRRHLEAEGISVRLAVVLVGPRSESRVEQTKGEFTWDGRGYNGW